MSDHRDFIGRRVVVRTHYGSTHGGILRFIKPTGEYGISDAKGYIDLLPGAEVENVVDGRHRCPSCGDLVNNVFGDDEVCASCERERAHERNATYTPNAICEDCGGPNAIMSPKAGKFRCVACHEKAGELAGTNLEVRAIQRVYAECKGKDVLDPRHSWVKVKGSRSRCRFCQVDTYQPVKGARTR